MQVLMLLMCVLVYFAWKDLGIRFAMILNPRGAQSYVDRQSKRIIRMLFVLGKYLVDFRILRESSLSTSLPRQFLLVSNHQSLLDIPVLLAAFADRRLRYVGKKELFHYILLISVVFRTQRHAKIDRTGNFADTMREIERLGRKAAHSDIVPVVFPEGTRARSGDLGPFRSGAVRTILKQVPLPVVSVAIDGGYLVSTLLQFFRSLTHLRYRVKTLSVYPAPRSKAEIDLVLTRAHTEIFAQIAEWRQGSRPRLSV